MKKRLLSLLLSLVMVLSTTVGITASAATDFHISQADMLYQMGLFKGTGTNEDGTPVYNLDAGATRMQGLIMLIRLLGEEEAALAYTGECPFTDVSGNSAKYAGYAYSKGYTTGTTATTFGNGPLKSNAFLTFCLRALGYDDKAGDFKYGNAYVLASEIGLIGNGEFVNQSTTLLRSGCVQIAHNALVTRLKGSDQTLIEKLVETGAVDKTKAKASGVYEKEPFYRGRDRDCVTLQKTALTRYGTAPLANAKYYGLDENIAFNYNPKTEADYINNLKYAFLVGNYSLNFCFPTTDGIKAFVEFVKEGESDDGRLKLIYATFPELMGAYLNGRTWRELAENSYYQRVVGAVYSNAELYQQQQEALAKALEISKSLHDTGKITDSMTHEEIVKVYYDYMQNYGVRAFDGFFDMAQKGTLGGHMKYDTAYSALILKQSACGGRAAAFNLFMHIEGIPAAALSCHTKSAAPDDGHTLNYLLIDGEEYLCDWGNNRPLQPYETAKNAYLDYVNEFSLSLARDAVGYNK